MPASKLETDDLKRLLGQWSGLGLFPSLEAQQAYVPLLMGAGVGINVLEAISGGLGASIRLKNGELIEIPSW